MSAGSSILAPLDAARSVSTPKWITSGVLKDLANIDGKTFRRLTQLGIIKRARKDPRGWWLYPEESVLVVQAYLVQSGGESPASPDGPRPTGPKRVDRKYTDYDDDEAVRVFRRLEEGMALKRIVIEEKLHPITVETVAQAYARIASVVILDEKFLARINDLPLPSPVRDATEVYNALRLSLRVRLCARCRKDERSDECLGCIVGEIERLAVEATDDAPAEDGAASEDSAAASEDEPAPAGTER